VHLADKMLLITGRYGSCCHHTGHSYHCTARIDRRHLLDAQVCK